MAGHSPGAGEDMELPGGIPAWPWPLGEGRERFRNGKGFRVPELSWAVPERLGRDWMGTDGNGDWDGNWTTMGLGRGWEKDLDGIGEGMGRRLG